MIWFIKKIKSIILKCFEKNANMFVKEKKTSMFIIDDIEIPSGDSDRENSDAGNSNEKK